MHIKKHIIKKLLKAAIIIAIFECAYLFVLPPILSSIIEKVCVKNFINKNSNANIEYKNPKIKTNILPAVTLSLSDFNIQDKANTYSLITADKISVKISLTSLLRKKINIKELTANNIDLYVFQDKDGFFNFEQLFPKKEKALFTPLITKTNININNYYAVFEDKILDKSVVLTGQPFVLNFNKSNISEFITKGTITNQNIQSDFDINMSTNFFSAKEINNGIISGKCFIYNINLDILLPYLKKYVDKDIKNIAGNIDYIQISTSKQENKNNLIVLNTSFNNVIFDKNSWENNINAKGNNQLHASLTFDNKIIDIASFKYKAENIDISSGGKINLTQEKPNLDLNVEVINSKAEDIAAILPPNLVPQYGTIAKVKKYGVYGDIEGKINIKGKIPQPDITGYVTGRNVHILDKSIHKLHKGTIDIKFDKRILNMDILVNLFDNQNAKVKGYVYMYRDGINNVSVKTTDNIDFPLAQKIIIPISNVFNFLLGPIPEMDIKTGKGIIDINVLGSIDFININGYSEFHDASLFYNGLFGKIEGGKGRLDFKKDVVSFKSEKAYVKNNLVNIDGKVKINDNLDFNISTPNAQAADLLEFINKSSLLKDVKDGMAVITRADGLVKLAVNIKAKIVPVEFGQPPLPPEEAFEDMKVNGSVYLLNNSCYLEGFYTPIEQLKGIVDFTETDVKLQSLEGVSGSSHINIEGTIITDLNTKVPDVDITVTSPEVNLKDTIKFLTESYLYPENYPDISSLYNIASKHDLYFKYKAKSIDFETDKAYAVMNFIPDSADTPIKAKSGKIIMDKAAVKVDNINASLYDSNLLINGNVLNVDTINPVYNLKIKTDNFNLENLNDTSKIDIMPQELNKILEQFVNYKGSANIDINIDKNILNGNIYLKNLNMVHEKTKTPMVFDNFPIQIKENKIILNNVTANIGDMPFFGDLIINDYYINPDIHGYLTTKITNNFIKTYLPLSISENIDCYGDIGFYAKINGTTENLTIEPKITLNPDSDIIVNGTNIGDINDKREFKGSINLSKDQINIPKFEYTKYISSQNNKTYPIVFMNASGRLKIDENNQILPEEVSIKTNKNLPAKLLNILLKTPVLKQGTFSCDLKYKADLIKKTSKLLGEMDCRNLDIPLFDTLIKNIRINAKENDINLSMFGYISDAKINMNSVIKNDFSNKPQIESLNLYADQLDWNKFLESLTKIHTAMNTNNNIKNIDFDGLSISDGHLEIKEFIIKSLSAHNFSSDFSINQEGIFTANNMQVDIGQGNMFGTITYNLNDSSLTGDFELNDVDSNYIAETIFDGKNQIYGNSRGKIYIETKGLTEEERIKNLSGYVYFDISDGRMPKLGSLEYLLRASNIIKSGITGFTINSILELLNLIKTGYFSNINGHCMIRNGIAEDIEIFSKGENLSLYIHGTYDIAQTHAKFEILGKLSKRISTIFGTLGNTSLNTFFKLIPGISLFDFSRKDFIEDVEKIPSFTHGEYESRIFQAIIDGDINESGYVQSFKWVQ